MRVCRACVAAAVEAAVSPLSHHGGVVEVGAGEAPGVVPDMMIVPLCPLLEMETNFHRV